jgi:AP-1 complex subunit gamma-1
LQFIQLRLDPASGNTVPAKGNGSVTQGLNVTNNQQGQVCEDLHPLPLQLLLSIFLLPPF